MATKFIRPWFDIALAACLTDNKAFTHATAKLIRRFRISCQLTTPRRQRREKIQFRSPSPEAGIVEIKKCRGTGVRING
jgi:hypothetical protein